MRSQHGPAPNYLPRIVIISFCLFLAIFHNPVKVTAQDKKVRPGIGLVLSGGGAHGIAHLGVIKVMEEAGLRPDYITGVSMGSIIGGLYSIGYTSDSLYRLLKTINWNLLLTNKIPENKVLFLEKNHFYNSALSLPISVRKVILPSSLINGQQIENQLSYYAWPAADIDNFSNLPIPFLCVASDIKTFKKVVLKTGYLPDAIRASFSVPSIFAPFKMDTLLLVDGGLTRNFAASEAKEMGADILIGSYVGYQPNKEDELQTLSGLTRQIALFRSLEDFREQKKLVDILITPHILKFPIYGFVNVDSLVHKGYEAALPYKNYFKRLADSLNRIAPQKPLKNILDKQAYTFNRVEIRGNKNYSDQQIRGILDIEPEEKVDKDLIADRIELLYGTSWFDNIKYKVVPRNDTLSLIIDCVEKPQAMLYGSLHYDNYLLTGLVLGASVKNFLTPRSVININSFVGHFFRFEINYLQFIDKNQKFGLSGNFYADNTLIPMLDLKSDRGDVFSRNFIPGLSLSRRLGLNQLTSLSLNYENRDLIVRYNSDLKLKNLSYNYISATYDFQRNTLDTKHFPGKGIILNFSLGTSQLHSGRIRTDTSKTYYRRGDDSEFSFDRYYTLYGSVMNYFKSTGKWTYSLGGDALWITDSESAYAQNNFYLLGGIKSVNKRSIPMIGYHSNEIPVKKLLGLRSELDFEFLEDLHLNLMVNAFAIQEVGRAKGFSLISGYGLGLGYMSIIGPIRIGIMHGNNNDHDFFNRIKGYISIGYSF